MIIPYTILPGDVNTAIITLSSGKVALIDTVDADLIGKFNWHVLKKEKVTDIFYAVRSIYINENTSKTELMHRVILNATEDQHIDHIDGDGLNNRRSNLRIVTRSLNMANMRAHIDGSSKYKGVSWDRSRRRWHAMLGKKNLGRFKLEVEAAKAYDKAAKELYGEFSRTNF